MVDRLSELRSASGNTASNEDVEVQVNGEPKDDEEASPFMKEFFEQVATIKADMAEIKSNIALISEQHGVSLAATSKEQAEKASQEIEALVDETGMKVTKTKDALKQMGDANKAFAEKNKGQAEERIRSSTHGTLTRKFVALMAEYQEAQTKFKTKYKERVQRQFKIVKPNATQDEIAEVVDGDGSHDVFTQQILSPGQTAAKNALADIQDRHQDIIALEKSIAELHQLFVDMAVLVEAQGELLDQIEYSVTQSVNYTEKGVQELQKANKYQQKSRNKMCCVAVILMIILVVILAPTLATTLKKASNNS